MSTMIKLLSLVLCIGLFSACEETPNSTFVYGTVEVDGRETIFQGTLGQSGDYDVYGKCKKRGTNLDFAVGHAAANQLDKVRVENPAYVNVVGVQGPPVKGVYDFTVTNTPVPPPKDLPALYTTFTNSLIANDDDQWSVTPTSATCNVELFATPLEGEVVFENNLNKSFDYYVRMECHSVSGTGQNNTRLRGFSAELFFENCS
jgi:hypothetical protein